MHNAGYTFLDRVGPGDDGATVLAYYAAHHRRASPEAWRDRIEAGRVCRGGVVLGRPSQSHGF